MNALQNKKSGFDAFPQIIPAGGVGGPEGSLTSPNCPHCGNSGLLWVEGRGTCYCACDFGCSLVDDTGGQDVFLISPGWAFDVPF